MPLNLSGLTRLAILSAALLGGCTPPSLRQGGLQRIEQVVVIYPENHSFDNLYGLFPGADGVENATSEQKTQLDQDGSPLPHLPPLYVNGQPHPRFPRNLPNGPFRIDAPPISARMDQLVPSAIHNFWHNREQINGGRNNLFVAMSDAGAWTMGYYDGSGMKLWQWAREYTLADRFFMAAYGGSFLNHQWLVCACTPVFREAPEGMWAQLDEHGRLKKRPDSPRSVLDGPVRVFDGLVSPDGYAVNSSQPAFQPSGIGPAKGNPELADSAGYPLPPQTSTTIGDTLSAKGISWAWYAESWNEAVADGRRGAKERRVIYTAARGGTNFQAHHQPFNYFARFAPGTTEREGHLKDGTDFLQAIDRGTLPQVAFYKPAGRLNQHPAYTDILRGDAHIADILERLRKSPQWSTMAVIVTYDENGGYWDHAPPPSGPGWSDRWGPGSRIPTVIVSPFAKRGFVDHTAYDTTSILKFITGRFGLEPLPGVRAGAGDLSNAFDFGR